MISEPNEAATELWKSVAPILGDGVAEAVQVEISGFTGAVASGLGLVIGQEGSYSPGVQILYQWYSTVGTVQGYCTVPDSTGMGDYLA